MPEWRRLLSSRTCKFLAVTLFFLSIGAAATEGMRGASAAPAPNFSFGQEDRDKWQQPDRVMDALGIGPGMTIGEVGAGHGYFTFRLSRRVGPDGKIYANDIDRDALKHIEERAKKENLGNIITILGEVERPLFPDATMDLVIMVYVLHDLAKPIELLRNIKPSLKENAPLVILEKDPEKTSEAAGHFYSKQKLLGVVEKAGYEVSRTETFLSQDTIYVCVVK